ncbi:transmembrane protein 198 [Oryzias melastigma]|uniref:Transmembrane protein 198 n=2 Tax=Oryzias melastigma TaxID=30732 RepID=A0A3B3CSA0_ORYME|nr:transmembrane protein 198 [Oryzias melastigma]XP_036068732.1 transmembrane protein 198 [Oryzias melastigma]
MAVTSFYVAEEPGAGLTELDICTSGINIQHDVLPSIVSSFCLSFGLIYCFFGYRCFKMVMFLSGFMFGSAAVLLVYYIEPGLNPQLGEVAKASIGLGVGVLCGLVTMLVSTLGLLLSGLQLGSLLSLSILVVIAQFHSFPPVWVPLTVVLSASIPTALFMVQWQKLFGIIYTSVVGATVVMLCVDYVVGTFMLPDQVYEMFCQAAPRPLCWYNWAITGISPVLSLLGVMVQWWLTAKGVSHKGTARRKQKKHSKRSKYRESGRPRPYRRRRPPVLKRYTGDVLAPSYLQSLQERQMGTGSSTSSVSTIAHTLIDFDFDTGSMVPLTAASPVFSV